MIWATPALLGVPLWVIAGGIASMLLLNRHRLLQTLRNAGVERPRLAVRFNDLSAGKRLRLWARRRFVLFGATYRAASRTG
jgi:hypothetical protein